MSAFTGYLGLHLFFIFYILLVYILCKIKKNRNNLEIIIKIITHKSLI